MVIIINKSTFLSELRNAVEEESYESLKSIFIQAAYYIEKDMYESVLKLFEKPKKIVTIDEDNISLFDKTVKLCESIENGEYDFTWGSEGYDDCWSDDENLCDQDGLSDEIQDLLETCISYVLDNRFEEAYKTFDLLFNFKVPMEEYDDINLSDLFENDLINLNLMDTLKYYAYSALMFLKKEERCEKLYNILCIDYHILSLNDIMKVSKGVIPCEDEFKKEWINFLKTVELKKKEQILIDAVKFSGGLDALKEFVIKYGKNYETSYIDLISSYRHVKDYDSAIKIAEDGLDKLDRTSENRAKIGDLLNDIGKETNNPSVIKVGIVEGFKSFLDLKHFMNLYELNDENLIKELVKYMDDKQTKAPYNHDDLYIHFLNKDYEFIFDKCKKDNKYSQWISSGKENMIPLFIALLAKSNPINPCIENYIINNFPVKHIINDFIRILGLSFNKISDVDYKKYMDYCLLEAENRVEEIVRGKHRGYYNKASAIVVSLAVVKGEENAEEYIKSYKLKYPRHSAFHECLKEDIKRAKFKITI